MKKTFIFFLITALSLSLFTSCHKKEEVINYSGSVMLYTTLDEKVVKAIKAKFEETYPGVILDYYYGDVDRVMRKIDAEFESDQPNADVFYISNELNLEKLKSESKIVSYKSKEEKSIPNRFKDKDNFYYAASITTMGICFDENSDIEESDLPKTYDELLNTNFSNMMVMVNPMSREYSKYFIMAMMQNENYGDSYFRRLRDYKIIIEKNENFIFEGIEQGNYYFGLLNDEYNTINNDKNLKFKYFSSDNVTMMNSVALVKGALNETNGKLLIDFLLSKEGQETLVNNNLVSPRSDIKNNLDTISMIKNSLNLDLEDIKTNGDKYIAIYNDIFGE